MAHTLNPIAALVASGLLAGTAALAQDGGTTVERVTISAEKRLTLLDDTPASVTALNGRALAEKGDTGLADLAALSPNTTFTTGQGAAQIFIRGIGNVFILAGGDPGVALYHDGAYVSDQTSANLGLFDIQRVEVLRGPQGALYGRNATGGALNVIANRPGADFKGRASVLLGDYGRREAEGFVTGALGGSGWQGRLSFQAKSLDGFTRNTLAGVTSGPVLAGGPSTTGRRPHLGRGTRNGVDRAPPPGGRVRRHRARRSRGRARGGEPDRRRRLRGGC